LEEREREIERERGAKMGRQMCELCKDRRAALIRPRNRQQLCQQCFFVAFENEIHKTIVDNRLFKPGERVAIAASGGKDSTVLAHVLTELNRRHNYGLDLFLLSIDEGITGYRDDSLETVKRNEIQYGIPLEVLSYKALYGWSMDEIVREIGRKNNCTFCGVFRRQVPNEIHLESLWFLLIWELSMLRVDVILKSAMTYIGFC
jgi:cytoplasmic tRNA 2-thiolation protein 1